MGSRECGEYGGGGQLIHLEQKKMKNMGKEFGVVRESGILRDEMSVD